ncbi:MAG: hypothetical protein ACAI25_18465 [Planctomycetota bacterium]
MKRLGAFALALALAGAPVFADDKSAEDRKAEDEAFAQKLLEIIQKVAEQAEDQSLDKTPYGALEEGDREAAEQLQRHMDNQRISLNVEDTPFADAIDFIRDVTGMNVITTTKAKEIAENAPKLKLKLKDVKVRNALELILTQTDPSFRYGIKNGVLQIGTQEDWKGGRLVVELIEVKDLVYRPPDFPAPPAGLEALEKAFGKWKK